MTFEEAFTHALRLAFKGDLASLDRLGRRMQQIAYRDGKQALYDALGVELLQSPHPPSILREEDSTILSSVLGKLRPEDLLSPEQRAEGDRVLDEMAQARQRASDKVRGSIVRNGWDMNAGEQVQQSAAEINEWAERLAEQEFRIGCELDRLTQHNPPQEQGRCPWAYRTAARFALCGREPGHEGECGPRN